MPLYTTDFTVWKGLDNTIEFSIRNHDRKAITLEEGSRLKLVAINEELQQKIVKDLEIVNQPLGKYLIVLSKDELNDYDEGLFTAHIEIVYPDDSSELLYTGTDWYPYFNIDIKPNKMELTIPTKEIDGKDFLRNVYTDTVSGKTIEEFTSSIIKSDITPIHTLMVEVKDFNGVLKLQGSNMNLPEHNADDWLDLKVINYEEEAYTGLVLINEEAQVSWVRVVYTRELDTPSTVIKMSYRQ